ncbi:transcriptional regulator, TetR family [Streptosporangium subroseum]|uniref:Transcriptional regulator, TetR family n=2 Tax=Streptosporangium subroseum TaxID=106412 RepID=A0A239NXP1_9ACTN|nr:transcriptional regulator, TetR family [Streptosporangium subroseum]
MSIQRVQLARYDDAMGDRDESPQARRRSHRAGRDDRDLRQVILDATRRLLDDRRFDELSVADILTAADVSRGSFYFYFAGKHQVLAELVRRAVDQGHEAAQPWLGHAEEQEQRATVRHGISQGAKLWRDEAPVLRAIVENWRSDPDLSALWLQLMNGYTVATAERIANDRASGAIAHTAVDATALATALTWLGERLYYLATIDVAPFDDQDALVDVLTHIWMTSLYSAPQAIGDHTTGSDLV